MITLIAAALAAAAPTAPAQPADAHAQHQQAQGHEQHGGKSAMKDCCCKDMMAKMHEGHATGGMQDHQDHAGK